MTELPFWKTETIGNDFVLIHETMGRDPSDLARLMCDRRFGIGSDGLLLVQPIPGPGWQVDMRMFNPDGSEDFCGNGLRCAAFHASQQGWASGLFSIRQHGVVCQVGVMEDGRSWATLPPASFDPSLVPYSRSGLGGMEDPPLAYGLRASADDFPALESGQIIPGPPADAPEGAVPARAIPVCGVLGVPISTGSTHFVVIVDELLGEEDFHRLSPQIEESSLFPERTSIMWTKPLDERTLQLRIWERGVGETQGCGTGSSASAVVWSLLSGQSGDFTIQNPGGPLQIHLPTPASPITSSSYPVERFEGKFWLP